MAVSRNGSHIIVVEKVRYRWRATGNDGYISLVIWPDAPRGAKIAATFDYHQTEVPAGEGWSLTNQLVITNRIVRRVLDHALQKGYNPAGTRQMNLRSVDKLIDVSDAERGK